MNKEFTLKCTLETRTSSKSNKDYQCLVLKFGNYEKIVFLDKAEVALLDNSK